MSDGIGVETYGERIADLYDEYAGVPADADAAAEFLAEHAGRGKLLELGVGTGRVAIPLLHRGFEVDGIDISPSMIRKLREKATEEEMHVVLGDMADVPVTGSYTLIFSVYNSFFGLQSQEEQVRCFRNAASHLAEGGSLVLENLVPDVTMFDRGQRVHVFDIQANRALIKAYRCDPVRQHIIGQKIVLADSGIQMFPSKQRYVWPSEMDLMAQLAGLELVSRSGGWAGESFTSASFRHVSVYRAHK